MPASSSGTDGKILNTLLSEYEKTLKAIERVHGNIKKLQDEKAKHESKLRPLRDLIAVYDAKALPAPTPIISPVPAARPAGSTFSSRAHEGEYNAVTWKDAMDWGTRNKLILGNGSEQDDLAKVNALRRRLQLPEFTIQS